MEKLTTENQEKGNYITAHLLNVGLFTDFFENVCRGKIYILVSVPDCHLFKGKHFFFLMCFLQRPFVDTYPKLIIPEIVIPGMSVKLIWLQLLRVLKCIFSPENVTYLSPAY